VSPEALKLTVYFGERDRADGGFLADGLTDIYARQALQTSLLLRGVQGFGLKHHLRTDRQLSLSEDLPLVSVAVDARPRIEAALAEVNGLRFDGLVTLERARMLTGGLDAVQREGLEAEVKLTVYLGRHDRIDGRPAYEAVIGLLHERGVAGATALLGVDGTAHGVRRRASFFASNAEVPVMVLSVGDGERIAEVLPELEARLRRPVITLERVRVCKRDGRMLAEPQDVGDADRSGLGVWQKLTVFAGEQSLVDGQPLHHRLIRELRVAGASGATSLRGIWGYHGADSPHGDSFWQLRRRVPVLTVIVDTPERARRWFTLIDKLTSSVGLVTSEIVPAFRATGPGLIRGGLRLAELEG
jgi:PII-like signaling protein